MFMKRAVITSLATGLFMAGSATAGQSTLYAAGPNLIGQGVEALQSGKYRQAIRLTRRGISQTTDDGHKAIGYNNLCIAYRHKGDLVKAVKACNIAVSLQPSYWRALNNRANVLFQAGDYRRAERDYRAALALKPGQRSLQENLKLVRREITLKTGE